MILVGHVIFEDHVTKGSSDMGRRPQGKSPLCQVLWP